VNKVLAVLRDEKLVKTVKGRDINVTAPGTGQEQQSAPPA